VNIIHIATHGLYAPSDKTSSISRFFTSIEEEDQILTRSGLILAGANNALLEEDILKGVDDGILTAFEISTLDLKEVDLVVLSACETGKGDITGDGVFGLQRGFKMAGVNSIIMSLWKVDDDATRLLMTEFYKHWMEGMSKHDALEKAKQAVRTSVEKDWSDPKYWAAFILLDSVD
jgi:CHAT domain-containing protein